MHGVNLGGWLSQCNHTKERYDNFISFEDIEKIKGWGLDHIRVPVDYNLVEDEDGNYKEEGFAYIQKAIDWAGKCGLNMVLDLHKTYGFSFDSGEKEEGFFENEAYQERFYKLWEEFARRYGSYRDRLCFELLNEVTSTSRRSIPTSASCRRSIQKWSRLPTKTATTTSVWASFSPRKTSTKPSAGCATSASSPTPEN